MALPVSRYSIYQMKYPDPFFDQASTKLPKSQHKLFEMLHLFATTHPQLRPIVHKLAKYPITHLIVNADNNQASLEKKWKHALEGPVNIYEAAEGVGLDYMGYGNCILTVHRPFARTYQCKSCNVHNPASNNFKYQINGKKIVGKCPKCGARASFRPHDHYTKNLEDISIVRIPPTEMYIKVNRLSGKTVYFRKIPHDLKKAVTSRRPDHFIIDTTPWKYVEAALHNKKIKYSSSRILHLREPTLSSHNSHWGQPIIMGALKDVYLNQIYKKADETVANERAVPARFVYPQMTSNDPMRTIGLRKWSRYMEQMIARRRHDPNAVMPVPFPVGVAEVGGDAQRLTTVNLRQMTVREIIGSTGVPEGFLSDGMTYSGGTVQSRMLENMIMSYLRAQDKLLRFVVREISTITGWPEVEVKWKPFRKADDIQMLQILLQLMQMNHVSGKEVLDRMDLNWDDQHNQILEETTKIQDIVVKNSLAEARAMLASSDLQISAQSQQEAVQGLIQSVHETAQGHEQELGEHEPGGDAELMQPLVRNIVKRLESMDPDSQNEYLMRLRDKDPELYDQVAMRVEIGESKNIDDIAYQIIMMPQNQKLAFFEKIKQQNPQLALLVIKKMKEIMSSGGGGSSVQINNQPPRQKPPRRGP